MVLTDTTALVFANAIPMKFAIKRTDHAHVRLVTTEIYATYVSFLCNIIYHLSVEDISISSED